jgi:hypothetical protein
MGPRTLQFWKPNRPPSRRAWFACGTERQAKPTAVQVLQAEIQRYILIHPIQHSRVIFGDAPDDQFTFGRKENLVTSTAIPKEPKSAPLRRRQNI